MNNIIIVIAVALLLAITPDLFAEDYVEEIATIEEDRIEAINNSYKAAKIADKWYAKEDKEIALEFDRIYLKDRSYMAGEIATKWYTRGEQDIAIAFERLYPKAAEWKFEELIKTDLPEAQAYGNKMLEFWISQNDEEIQIDLDEKLTLAAKVESIYYYEILKSKLNDKAEDTNSRKENNVIHNYSKYLENTPLSPPAKDSSITDSLIQRTYINPDVLNHNNLSLEEARKMLEVDLYHLSKKNNIIFSILHIIALYARENPYFKLHIFYENPLGKSEVLGLYTVFKKHAEVSQLPLNSQLFRETLTHEWTHQLMDILFHNLGNPYHANDHNAKIEWESIIHTIKQKVHDAPHELKNTSKLNPFSNPYEWMLCQYEDIKRYPDSEYGSEAIARFSQMLANDAYDDPKVHKFLCPISDYWIKYIQPVIDQYVQDHASINFFVSDSERENVLDPFYRFETERDEFNHDLKIAKNYQNLAVIFLGDKWYERGQIDHAIKFDKLYLQSHSSMGSTFADKWYERGEKEIALEFEHIHLQYYPQMTDSVANKWYERGERDFAFEINRDYFTYLYNLLNLNSG